MLQQNLSIIPLLAVLYGCSGQPLTNEFHNKVIVDMAGVNPVQYQKDLKECQGYAAQVTTSDKVIAGAATGGALGGLIGAAVGNSSTAKKGAGAGAVTGGARGAFNSYEEKSRVIRNCLLGRGYSVLN